ncbi:hypothetical protein [Bosea sp. 685]|uniref:hypothetical protein n=1 Tax=Bosea sp. 685 TaxID=3080057 RepID=UPI0028935AE8|nr:hypothetical protein [Bosea sp. 685]WNJ93030.1 hypothetical protein RMR04_12370 [Bosea sp. 685]
MSKKSSSDRRLLHGYITGPGVFSAMPDAAIKVVAVMGFAAAIDHHWATILASLSGSEIDTAMVLLESLSARGGPNQDAAIVRLAELKLEPTDASIVRLAVNALRPHRDRRNDFAHGLWARPIDDDDRLVLLRPKHAKKANADIAAYLIHGTFSSNDLGTVVEEGDFYGAADFADALDEAGEAHDLIINLARLVMNLSVARHGQWVGPLGDAPIRGAIRENPAFKKAVVRDARKSRSAAI